MTLADRLKSVREDLKKSQKEIAAQIGISFRAWQDYELGKNIPGSAVIAELVKLGYNANWILTGEGMIKEGFNLELLTFIIGALDHLEASIGVKIKSVEKSIVIIYTYLHYFNADLALNETRFALVDNVKGNYHLFTSLDTIIDTKKGQEQAKKTYIKILSDVFTHDDAEQAAEALIGAKLTKK